MSYSALVTQDLFPLQPLKSDFNANWAYVSSSNINNAQIQIDFSNNMLLSPKLYMS